MGSYYEYSIWWIWRYKFYYNSSCPQSFMTLSFLYPFYMTGVLAVFFPALLYVAHDDVSIPPLSPVLLLLQVFPHVGFVDGVLFFQKIAQLVFNLWCLLCKFSSTLSQFFPTEMTSITTRCRSSRSYLFLCF